MIRNPRAQVEPMNMLDVFELNQIYSILNQEEEDHKDVGSFAAGASMNLNKYQATAGMIFMKN